MKVRPAESADRHRIRAIARDSLQSSYSLSPQEIEMILDEEFDDPSLTALLDDAATAVLVVDGTIDGPDEVIGFVTLEYGDDVTIRWLHVDPETRGRGIATALLDRVLEETDGEPVRASVLEDAVEGGEFFEGFGLERSGNDQVVIGGEEFAVTTFTEGDGTASSTDPTVPGPESVPVDGADRPVDRDEPIPGREAPFFPVDGADDDREDAYGYVCSRCGGTDVAADGLDRLECGACGNAHLADEWDDAYL